MSESELSQFIAMARRYPLLSAVEEIELSRLIQPLRDIERLQNDSGPVKLDDQQLADAMKLSLPEFKKQVAVAERARQRMINCNLRLVISVALKHRSQTNALLSVLDLIQEGAIGLQIAAERFDHTKGYKFSTYAMHWVRREIRASLSSDLQLIRTPSRKPGSPATFLMVSIDAAVGDRVAFQSSSEREIFAEQVREQLQRLNPRTLQVVSRRFGIDGDVQPLQEISDEIGLGYGTTRNIVSQTLSRLKRHPEWQQLYEGLCYAN